MDQQNNHQPMQAGKTTCACGAGCNCGCGYGYGRHPGYHLLRWALGLFILFFVFAVGVKVGEFLTALRSYMNYNREYPMMMGNHGYYGGEVAVPAGVTNSAAGVQSNP